MPRPLAGAGRLLEARVAPPFYRGTEVVTPSEATRDELIELGFRPERVTAVDNGVDSTYFSPGRRRSTPRRSSWRAGRHGARQAVPAAAGGGRAGPRRSCPSSSCASSATGRSAPGAGGLDRRPRCPGLGAPAGPRRARRAAGRVPPGLGRGQRLARRGLGSDPDRGARPAARRRWRRTSAAIAARSSTGRRASWPSPEELGDALASVLLDADRRAGMGDAARAHAPR